METKKSIIDEKDRKILSTLCIDARTPLGQIAKKVLLSPEGISYRIRQLEKRGIIQKYSLYPDEYQFGLHVYHVYFKFKTLPRETEQLFKQSLIETGFCSLIRKTRGNWDFICIFFAKSPFHFDQILEKTLQNPEFLIKKIKGHFITHQYCFSQLVGDYFLNVQDKYKRIPEVISRIGHKKLSLKEIKLLKYINNNGRQSFEEMGKHLHEAPETLRYNYNRLKEEKVIVTTFAVLDKFKLGYLVNSIDISLNTNSENLFKPLIFYLINNPYVHYSAKATGLAEIQIIFLTLNNNTFEEELEKIRNKFYNIIEDIEINPVYSEEGHSMFPEAFQQDLNPLE